MIPELTPERQADIDKHVQAIAHDPALLAERMASQGMIMAHMARIALNINTEVDVSEIEPEPQNELLILTRSVRDHLAHRREMRAAQLQNMTANIPTDNPHFVK